MAACFLVKPTIVAGIVVKMEAKITGITPAAFILSGKNNQNINNNKYTK